MTRLTITVAVVVLTSAPAVGTNIWLSESGTSSPLGEMPTLALQGRNRLHFGDHIWLWVWGRPDEGKTLLNWNLLAGVTNPSVLKLVDARIENPLLGNTGEPLNKDIVRYEFTGVDEPDEEGIDFRGFSVNAGDSQTIGAGMGPNTAGVDPGYDPANDAWLMGSLHLILRRPGHAHVTLAIGPRGLNNAGEPSVATSVVFGSPNNPPFNGEFDRGVPVEVAWCWCIPEPSSVVLFALGCVGWLCFRRWAT